MARTPRGQLVDPAEMDGYHCVQRAMRAARLCGQNPLTGKNFDQSKV
jgi:hypothetical protein